MFNIYYTPESEDNLAEVFTFISWDNVFYAVKVIASIKTTIDILKIFPLSWQSIDTSRRMVVDSKYRYKIIYTVKNSNVYILSISKYKSY